MTKKTITIPVLESQHYEWLFAAAQEHFADKIAKLELDNIRHTQLAEEALYASSSMREPGSSRTAKIERNTGYIKQYKLIVEFCSAVRRKSMDMTAEEVSKNVSPKPRKQTKKP